MSEVDFPSWMYGPNGAARVFDRAEDVPAGWVDSPAKVGEAEQPKPAPKGKGKPALVDPEAPAEAAKPE